MKSNIYRLAALMLAVLMLAACGSSKKAVSSGPKILNLALVEEAYPNRYVDLDYGIRLNVREGRSDTRIVQKYDASAVSLPAVRVNPDLASFVGESARRYMRTMGFVFNADMATDYMMTMTLREFAVNYLSGVGWSGTVQMNIEVHDRNGRLVYPNVVVSGRANGSGNSSDFIAAAQTLNKAYANALRDIDWDRIAFFLRKADTPALEKNKQVTGDGNTSLEATVIRWYIDSSPRGADVSSRIVSSVSDVKNTNQNYVGSTPYETTETFDIKGLTFNNSGNVQIEITCEKPGYITQKRRFNLRQVIEQKEISTKFNLVKEE